MNLMVILVPFLLITAVFSRLAILQLNLPGSSPRPWIRRTRRSNWKSPCVPTKSKSATVTRALSVCIGAASTIGDFEALSAKLVEIKKGYPTKTDVAVLLEQDIPYDVLVQVMDRVRVMCPSRKKSLSARTSFLTFRSAMHRSWMGC